MTEGSAKGAGLSRPAPIEPSHDVHSFSCGHESLDEWLKQTALKAEGKTARTYVVCEANAVVGYYCLSTGSVARNALPRKIRQNNPDPVPVMIIGRLAVATSHKRQGIGSGLLKDAFQRILEASRIAGFRAVLVHAIDDEAVGFYEALSFVEFPDGSRTMFLPVETLAAALG